MLALADRHGEVFASVPGLARRAGVTIDETEKALQCLLSPDPYSRTKDFDGRRIEEIDGGWVLLNHPKYRALMSEEERREYNRLKQQESRERRSKCQNSSANVKYVNDSQQMSALSAHTDSDSDSDSQAQEKGEKKKGTEKECEFSELPFPSDAFKSAWTDWVAFRREIKKPVTPTMAKAQLRQLRSLNERRAIAMIEHTIGKGWQGLREQDGAAEMYPEQQERSEEIGEEDLAERLRLNRERRIAQEVEAQGRAPKIVDDGMGELF